MTLLDRNWYVIRSGKRDNIIDLFTRTAKPARWSVFMHQDLTRDLQRLSCADHDNLQTRLARLLIQTLKGINRLFREGESLREKSLCVLKIYFDPTINCTRKNWYLVRFLTHFRLRTFDKIKEGNAGANFNTFVRYRAERYKYRAHVLLAVVQCVTISAADADHALIVINGQRYCVPRPLPFVVSAAYA